MSLLDIFRSSPSEIVTKDYRETQTGDRYRIKFERRSNGFTIYVLNYPRDPHGKGPHVHHRYNDGHICVAVPVPTLAKAKAVAIHWMTGWSGYIRSSDGIWPRNGHVRINVPD